MCFCFDWNFTDWTWAWRSAVTSWFACQKCVTLPRNGSALTKHGWEWTEFSGRHDTGLPLPETNVSPEKWWWEDQFPIEMVPLQGDIRSFSGWNMFVCTLHLLWVCIFFSLLFFFATWPQAKERCWLIAGQHRWAVESLGYVETSWCSHHEWHDNQTWLEL